MGVARVRPTFQGDNPLGGGPGRASNYGDAYVVPVGISRGELAAEGSYFTAFNATTATELTGHAAPAIGDEATKPFLYLYNGGARLIVIDQVTIRVETVNASASDTYWVASTTNEQSRDSGGTALTVNSARSDNNTSSGATVYAGAVICTPSASKLVARTLVRSTIMVTEDIYQFQFGGNLIQPAPVVATLSWITVAMPPLVVAPGGEFLFTSINPSGAATAATHEVGLGFYER